MRARRAAALFVCLVLVGCTGAAGQPTASPEVTSPTLAPATPSAAPTATTAPTPTPEPTPTPVPTVDLPSITGRITDLRGDPVADAVVQAIAYIFDSTGNISNSGANFSVRTNADGTYRIAIGFASGPFCVSAQRQGSVQVWFGLSGWTIQISQLRCLTPGPTPMVADLVLPDGTPVSGTVTDKNSAPFPGVTVTAEVRGQGYITGAGATTDDAGHFSIAAVPATWLLGFFVREPGTNIGTRQAQLELQVGTKPVTGLKIKLPVARP